MPGEYDQFRCPCCGQHAPVSRILDEGPFDLAQFHKSLGGKVKLTYEQRLDRSRKETYRGSGAGRLDYKEVPLEEELLAAMVARLREVLSQLGIS